MIKVLSSGVKIYDYSSLDVSFPVLEFIISYFSFIFITWLSDGAKWNIACIGRDPGGKGTVNSRIVLQVTCIYRAFLVQRWINLAVEAR